MDRKPSGGFTLLELLVAMAVAGILLGVGVPSFVEVMKNARLSTQHNDLLQSLYLARSEAIKGTADVVVAHARQIQHAALIPTTGKTVGSCSQKSVVPPTSLKLR